MSESTNLTCRLPVSSPNVLLVYDCVCYSPSREGNITRVRQDEGEAEKKSSGNETVDTVVVDGVDLFTEVTVVLRWVVTLCDWESCFCSSTSFRW